MNTRIRNPHGKALAACLALAICAGLPADRAHAQASSATSPSPPSVRAATPSTGIAKDAGATAAEAPPSLAAMDSLRQIASRLDETALQRAFRTDGEELTQLASVRDQLGAAMGELCCARRAMALRLQSNLERVIATAHAQLDPTLATYGAAFGPSAPNRDELAILAKESQALVRNSAIFPVSGRTSELLSARHEDPRSVDPRDEAWSAAAPGNSWIEFSPGRQGMQMYGWRF